MIMSLQVTGVFNASFSGKNGSGAISVPGLAVGDIVLAAVQDSSTVFDHGNNPFENVVSVADEIQQVNSSDLSANSYEVVVFRGC